MGQYYVATTVESKQFMSPHRFGGNGAKLMEHSWIRNDFVQQVEAMLTPHGPWHKHMVVWAGDYADTEKERLINLGHADLAEQAEDQTLYGLHTDETISPFFVSELVEEHKIDLTKYPYIVNHTLKQYVDKRNLPQKDEGEYGIYTVHPLPLLTAEGNNRGGGDYRDGNADFDKVGLWARHSISVEQEVPEGYTEFIVGFIEN